MRREWIEMSSGVLLLVCTLSSPSMRREWIEIFLFTENSPFVASLPPCGGSGLKYDGRNSETSKSLSPSMRREWIEMSTSCFFSASYIRLPPCGGSGLKFGTKCRPWLVVRLPPCGGSGLKLLFSRGRDKLAEVSLHAEGVD